MTEISKNQGCEQDTITAGAWDYVDNPDAPAHFGVSVCWEVGSDDAQAGIALVPSNEANARLIAAAPDLLAACVAVNNHLLTTFPPYTKGESPYDKVRAAITKATTPDPVKEMQF